MATLQEPVLISWQHFMKWTLAAASDSEENREKRRRVQKKRAEGHRVVTMDVEASRRWRDLDSLEQ
jgi:hypothetical protein